MKRLLFVLLFSGICLFTFTAKAYSLKEVDSFITSSVKPYKIEPKKVYNSQYISAEAGRTLFTIRLSGIICNEFTKYKARTSSTGTLYYTEAMHSVRIEKNTRPTKYMDKLVEENEDNLYFLPHGRGIGFSVVGELFIGSINVNDLLVRQGYCRKP